MSRMRFLLHVSSALITGSTHINKAWGFLTPAVSWGSWERSLQHCLSSSPSSVEVRTFSAETNPSSKEDGRPPFFRIYYNDVYEVELPPRHRFPMKKYAQVRKQIQKWIADLPEEEQRRVNCGTYGSAMVQCGEFISWVSHNKNKMK
jgi:hypothetical protein